MASRSRVWLAGLLLASLAVVGCGAGSPTSPTASESPLGVSVSVVVQGGGTASAGSDGIQLTVTTLRPTTVTGSVEATLSSGGRLVVPLLPNPLRLASSAPGRLSVSLPSAGDARLGGATVTSAVALLSVRDDAGFEVSAAVPLGLSTR